MNRRISIIVMNREAEDRLLQLAAAARARPNRQPPIGADTEPLPDIADRPPSASPPLGAGRYFGSRTLSTTWITPFD